MKGKGNSSHHREQNTYRFQTFSERLAVVNVDVARRVQKLSATPEDADTFFGEALRKWSELNYTQHFVDFRQEVSGTVFSFTQLIHHQKKIITALLKHLQVPDSLAYQPLLDLLVQVARDLQSDFYVYFEDVLPVLVSLLQTHHHDTDVLEQTFTGLSYIFKFLWRAMVNNIHHVYRLVSPLLSDAYREYINNFAAESFAFLMRKVKNFSELCDAMFSDLENHPDQVAGVGRLLFESVKGVQKGLHSAADKMLPVVIQKLGRASLPQTQVVACLSAMLNSLVTYTDGDHTQPLWTPLLAELRSVHSGRLAKGASWSEHLGRLLELVLPLVTYRKGTLVLPVNQLTEVLLVLLSGPPLDPLAGDLLLQTTAGLLVAEKVSLTFRQQGALTAAVYNTTYTPDQLTQFTRDVLPMPLFEKDVLPPLLTYCARRLTGRETRRGRGREDKVQSQDTIIQLLAELILHKAPPPVHAEMLHDYNTYLLDFGSVTTKCEDSKSVPSNLLNKLQTLTKDLTADNVPTVWAIVLCLPHIRPLDGAVCSDVLLPLMDVIPRLAADTQDDAKDAALCVWTEALLVLIQKQTSEEFFHSVTPDTVLQVLRSFPGNTHVLRGAALYFTHAASSKDTAHVTGEDLFKQVLPALEKNLSSPHGRVRLLTLQICVQFDLPMPALPQAEGVDDRVGVFRVCLEAEKVGVSVHTYRSKLVHLQKLDFSTLPYQLPIGPYDTVALHYLIGQLYLNFTLLWPPVLDLIRSHAVGMKPAVFWDIYETHMNAVAERTESAGFYLDRSPKSPPPSPGPVSLSAVFTSHRTAVTAPDRTDHFNFRKLLWTSMQHFPEVCQPKSRLIVTLFFRFLEREFYPANSSIAPTEDLSPRAPTQETQETGETEDDEDEEEEEETGNVKGRRRKQRPYNSILVTHLGLFAKLKNPKSLYQEGRLRELYYELLPHRSPAVQKVAFECIMTYKNKALLPYKENLERLMDDKTFKNEIVLFSIDKEASVLQDDHRPEVLPVLISILYGKMQTKTGKDTGGRSAAHARRSIVFRFLAGCQQPELKIFFDLVFRPLAHYIRDDVTSMVMTAADTADVHKVVPLKKQQSLLTTVDVILHKLGSLLDSYLPSLLRVLLGLLAQVSVLLGSRSLLTGRAVTLLKGLRQTGVTRLNQFMATYPAYPYTRAEIDAIFRVAVWPQLERLPTEGIYSPTGLLSLVLTWSRHKRFFDLFRKRRADLDLGPDPDLCVLPVLVSLLKVKAASPTVTEMTLEVVYNLLTQHEDDDLTGSEDVTEQDVMNNSNNEVMEVEEDRLDVGDVGSLDNEKRDQPRGVRILLPHVPAVLDYVHGVVDTLLRQKGRSKTLPHRVLTTLARLSEYVTDTEQCGRMVALLFPFLSRNLNRSVDVEMSILRAIQHMVRLTPRPDTYVRTMAKLFSSLTDRSSRSALCDTLSSIGECSPAVKPLADVVTKLNAWDVRYVEEPDYLVRLEAYRQALTLVRGETGDDYTTHALVTVYNCVYFINTAVDMSLRDSASLCIQELVKELAARPDNTKLVNMVVKAGLLPEVKAGLKLRAEVARHEYVLLLSHLIKFFPDVPVFRDLSALSDPDIEADFFANLVHIQLHRRGRAMRRILRVLGQQAVTTETLSGYLLPLVTAYLRDEAYLKQAVILDAVVETIAGIAKCLPWSQYIALLRHYLNLLPQSLTNQKLMVRVIVGVLDSFHFDLRNSEETAETALKAPGVANREVEEDGPAPAEKGRRAPTSANTNQPQDTPQSKDKLLEPGAEDKPEDKPLHQGAEKEPGDEEEEEEESAGGDVKSEQAVSMLGAVTVCSPALATRIHRTLIKVIIPQLHHSLTRKVKSDDEHKKAKAGTYAEDEEVLRVPIALALVKLMQSLPHKTLDFNLPGLLFKLCHFLRSRAIDIRTTSRDTLVKIMKSLRPSYFSYVLKELRFTLKRGYQLHVLCYTVHTLLKSLETTLTCGDLERSIGALVEVFNLEIFGPIAEEKNVIGITSKLMEAKSTKSYDSYAILAKFVAKGSLGLVISPLRGILSSTVSHKMAAKVEDVLRKLVPGLLTNTSLELNDLMTFTFGLTSEVMPLLAPNKKKKKKHEAPPSPVVTDPRLPPSTTYTVQPLPSRAAPKAKTQLATNMHILVEFGLQILYSLLKHSTLNHKELEHAKLLDPFVPTLTKGLTAKYAKVTSVSLRCVVWVFKFPLPSLKAHIKRISDGLFVLLKNYAAAGAAATGDNMELIDVCFKAVTVLVRDVDYHTIKMEELKVLLTYAEQDIHDHTRQATAFSLLKAILSRKLVVPEMHDVMKKIEELSITAHDGQVRQNCRQVAIKFLLNYPLGARLEQHLEFYVSQLEYEHDTGRESALEMLATMFEAFPPKLLHEYSGFFFVPLASQLVNDDSARCRRQAGLALKQLLSKLETETRDELFSMIVQWFKDDKLAVNKLACLACGVLVEVESTKFERHLDTVVPILDRLTTPDQLTVTESSEERQADHLLYSALTLTSKLVRLCNLIRRPLWARPLTAIWVHVEQLLLYPHVWVRLASAELFGLMLAAWTPQELAARVGKPTTTTPLYLQDNTMEKLHDLCGVFCRQLASPQLDQVLANQILKNLVFLGKVLRYLPKGPDVDGGDKVKRAAKRQVDGRAKDSTPDQEEEVAEEVGEKTASLEWLLSRLCREARAENANTPKEVLKRTSVFKWMAAMALELGGAALPPYLPRILPLLVRELTDKSPNADEDLRKLTKEVLDLLKVTVGVATFTTAYAEVLKTLVDKRQTRKRDRATELISNPELSAKRKLKKNLAKQKAKKRKIEDIRPVKRTKKHKFIDIPDS